MRENRSCLEAATVQCSGYCAISGPDTVPSLCGNAIKLQPLQVKFPHPLIIRSTFIDIQDQKLQPVRSARYRRIRQTACQMVFPGAVLG